MTYSDVMLVRLYHLCQKKKITFNKLATISGLRQSTIGSMIAGKSKSPTLRTLHKIAVGLEMTVSELLDFPEMNDTIFNDE